MPPPKSHSFQQDLLFSEGVAPKRQVFDVLLDNIPGSKSVTRACVENDRSGVDYWVETTNCRHLAIDVKVRREDFAVHGSDDLALETWSVVENRTVGWTRNALKRADYILWLWADTGRWCMISFPQLCAVMQANWQEWRRQYKTAIQKTNEGNYHSECVYVPRKVVWLKVYERFSGVPRSAGVA